MDLSMENQEHRRENGNRSLLNYEMLSVIPMLQNKNYDYYYYYLGYQVT